LFEKENKDLILAPFFAKAAIMFIPWIMFAD
jgi:hypothetical protein